MIGINDIKNNKLVLRDYVALIKEIINSLETNNDNLYTNIEETNSEQRQQFFQNVIDDNNIRIIELINIKNIFKEYINSNFINSIDNNDLIKIYDDGISYVDDDVKNCYPSIFNENTYFDLIRNLENISSVLLNKTVINNEVYDYIIDYLHNYNSFDIWKIMFTKCVYILCDHITKYRNETQTTHYSNIEEFNNCVDLQTTPITSFPYQDYADEYIEFVEVLFEYYVNETRRNSNVHLLDSDDENDNNDNEHDNDNNEHPLINKYTLIENNENYDCGICFNDYENDYFKCNRCIFKICPSCYNNYHLQHNVKNCAMCRL